MLISPQQQSEYERKPHCCTTPKSLGRLTLSFNRTLVLRSEFSPACKCGCIQHASRCIYRDNIAIYNRHCPIRHMHAATRTVPRRKHTDCLFVLYTRVEYKKSGVGCEGRGRTMHVVDRVLAMKPVVLGSISPYSTVYTVPERTETMWADCTFPATLEAASRRNVNGRSPTPH